MPGDGAEAFPALVGLYVGVHFDVFALAGFEYAVPVFYFPVGIGLEKSISDSF